jgi:phosphoribosyl-ATP pyrophosphohydrolase
MPPMARTTDVLPRLMATIEQRKAHPRSDSYTSKLLSQGVAAIGAKVGEEAAEFVAAAHSGCSDSQHEHLVHEAADLVYHLLVMLAWHDVRFEQVEAELARRFGVSGLVEKASRTTGDRGDKDR